MKIPLKITLLGIALFSFQSFADGMIRTDFGYVMDSKKSGGSESKDTRQIIELAGGYLWTEGWTAFGQYAMETDTSVSGGSTTTYNRTSYGPGVGWSSRQPVGVT